MEKEKKSKAIIILSAILVFSVLFNLSLIFTMGNLDTEWENAYEKNDIEWCEILNDENDLINNLLTKLGEYDTYFADVELIENQDCWR